jgi:hypothetical protein
MLLFSRMAIDLKRQAGTVMQTEAIEVWLVPDRISVSWCRLSSTAQGSDSAVRNACHGGHGGRRLYQGNSLPKHISKYMVPSVAGSLGALVRLQ